MMLANILGTKYRISEEEINKLATNNRNKNVRNLYRGKSELKKGYQRRTHWVKNENSDLLADSHNKLSKRKNYVSQLVHIHRVTNVGQMEIHAAEPFVPEPINTDKIKICITTLKKA
jgi:hypothetical protein